MQSLQELLSSGVPFIWKTKFGQKKMFSFPDDHINGVRHIYSDAWRNGEGYSDKFSHSGIVIGNVVYDASYAIEEEVISQGFETKRIAIEHGDLKAAVIEEASKIIYDKALEKAKAVVALAKTDLSRVKEEEAAKGEEYRFIDYSRHDQNISKTALENIHYSSEDGYYSSGIAYQAFYKNIDMPIGNAALVKANVTERDTMWYLAADDKTRIVLELVNKTVVEANSELQKKDSYIIDNLVKFLVAEEIYSNLVNDTAGTHYLIRDIYDKVHGELLADAKTVKVTAEIEGEIFTFTIGKKAFRREYAIDESSIYPMATLQAVKGQLKKRNKRLNKWCSDRIFLSDILEITYKKKIVYKKEA